MGQPPEQKSSGIVDDTLEEASVQAKGIRGLRWVVFISSTLTAVIIYAMDNTITANIIPAIVNDLGESEKLPWLTVGFTLGGIAPAMLYGKLYAHFDNKIIYIATVVIFLAGSALCGSATTMNVEIIGRLVAGIGGNGMYLGAITLTSAQCTDKERPVYLSVIGIGWGLGSVLGPVVGGGFETYTWRWAFYINLVIGSILLISYFLVVPSNDPSGGQSVAQRLRNIDWTGAFLSCSGFTLLTMAINLGGVIYAWHSPAIIVFFVLAGISWGSFAVQQIYVIFTSEQERMFPVDLIHNRQVVLLFVCGCVGGFLCDMPVMYIALYFQFTRGISAIQAAVRLLPFIGPLVLFVVGGGVLLSRWGYYKPFYLFGGVVGLLGNILMSQVDLNTNVSQVYGWEVLLGASAGAYVQISFSVIQTLVEAERVNDGITLMLVAQLSGVSFGLSVAGAIFINQATAGLETLLPSSDIAQIRQAVSGASNGFLKTLTAERQIQALDVLVGAIRSTFILASVAAGLCLLCSVFLRHSKLNS